MRPDSGRAAFKTAAPAGLCPVVLSYVHGMICTLWGNNNGLFLPFSTTSVEKARREWLLSNPISSTNPFNITVLSMAPFHIICALFLTLPHALLSFTPLKPLLLSSWHPPRPRARSPSYFYTLRRPLMPLIYLSKNSPWPLYSSSNPDPEKRNAPPITTTTPESLTLDEAITSPLFEVRNTPIQLRR